MSAADFSLDVPTIDADDVLTLADPRFEPGSVAIVTGAASGVGEACAVALALNGLTVVGADVDADGMAETGTVIDDVDAPGRFVALETDLTDDDDVEALVAAAADRGELRYVANVAGVQHIAPIPEFPMKQYDFLVDLMLRAPFLVAKHAMTHIRETDDGVGAIANMSSVHGHLATRDKSAYVTAKHGLTGLTRSIAAEGEGTLRSFTVSVGYVLTPLMRDQIADTARERGISEREVVEEVMLGPARTKALMTPLEVANLFTFGFSRHGRHLNGGDLCFDGGYTTTYE